MAPKFVTLAFAAAAFVCYIRAVQGDPVLSKEKPADAEAKTALDKAFANDPDMDIWVYSSLKGAKRTPLKYATTTSLDGKKLYFIKTKVEPKQAGSKPMYVHYLVSKDSSANYKGELPEDTQADGTTPHTATDPITYFGDLAGPMATGEPVSGPVLSKEKAADAEAKNALVQAFKNDPKMEGWMGHMLNFAKRTPLTYATATGADGKKLYFIKTKVEPAQAKNANVMSQSGSDPMYVVYEVSKDSKGNYKGEGIDHKITATGHISSF